MNKTKKKQCKKGYSCGVSCISTTKACRKEFPDGVSISLETRAVALSSDVSFPKKHVATPKVDRLKEELKKVLGSTSMPKKRQSVREDLQKALEEEFKKNKDRREFTPISKQDATEELVATVRDSTKNPRELQSDVYEALGYNAKPDLVDSRRDMMFNDNLMKGEDGLPRIMFRGVDDFAYHDELRVGDKHYVGLGIFGNGTYAAAPLKQSAIHIAGAEADQYGGSIVAISLKKEARFFQRDLEDEVKLIAKKLNLNPKKVDHGIIMALGGWDAYRGSEALRSSYGNNLDYVVILNRGAMVISKENIENEDIV